MIHLRRLRSGPRPPRFRPSPPPAAFAAFDLRGEYAFGLRNASPAGYYNPRPWMLLGSAVGISPDFSRATRLFSSFLFWKVSSLPRGSRRRVGGNVPTSDMAHISPVRLFSVAGDYADPPLGRLECGDSADRFFFAATDSRFGAVFDVGAPPPTSPPPLSLVNQRGYDLALFPNFDE